jgi:hypothetical protein
MPADPSEAENRPSHSQSTDEHVRETREIAETKMRERIIDAARRTGLDDESQLRIVQALFSYEIAEASDKAQQSMFRDIDVILARLENGIAAERTAMDALLDRLTSKAGKAA